MQFGKVGPEEFVIPKSVASDSSPNAVILGDYGTVSFVGNNKSWFSYVFKRHTRILILNKKAMDLASTSVTQYVGDEDDAEKIENIQASTYNLVNGNVAETKLDKKEIFEEKEGKHYVRKKWTFPGVKEGSIIELTYTKTSPWVMHIPEWSFQSMEYPTVWSEYNVEIPQALFYVTVRQGVHPFTVDKGSEGKASYQIKAKRPDGAYLTPSQEEQFVSAITIKHRWAMKDVPAFHVENYLTTPRNYLDHLSFQLEKTYDNVEFHDVMNSWKKATEDLLNSESFGLPLKEDNDWLDETLTKIDDGHSTREDLARKIYYYVSGHFTCTDHDDFYINTNLRNVFKKNSGDVGEVNMLLIAMLRRQQFTADPVLLSTREYGLNIVKYPIMDKLNYMVVRLVINGKVYYLDAANPRLGFGQLAGYCYNGHARVISEKDSASIYFEADSLKESKRTMVLLTNGAKGLEGSYQCVMGPQESYETRESVGTHGKAAYFKRIRAGYGEDAEISNEEIDSLDQPEKPLTVHYEFALRPAGDASLIYFNPVFGDGLRENPFKAAERKYPVEMPYVMDQIYVLNMEIPQGYIVDELPKSTRVSFNEDQGLFEYLIAKQENSIQLQCRIKLNRANFSPDDYSSLRDFFAFIVKKESEQIVLKKQ